jgi:hypothetical protein
MGPGWMLLTVMPRLPIAAKGAGQFLLMESDLIHKSS